MSELTTEPHDSHLYSGVNFYPETLRFIFKSLCFYHDLLEKTIGALEIEGDLKDLLCDNARQDSAFNRELKTIERTIKWHKDSQKDDNSFDYDLGSLSHGSIRTYKSVCALYFRHLQQLRNDFARRTNISKYALEDVDANLAKYEEKLNIGVFAVATARPLLVDDLALTARGDSTSLPVGGLQPENSLAAVHQPTPRFLESIEIFDPTLRERCLDLFHAFREPGKHDRLDTVLADATRILEDRMRKVLDETGGTGDKLTDIAFGGQPKLFVSANRSEQQAVMFLFKAIFGHIRNPSHHKLLGPLIPERTLQILGIVDYAIYILEGFAKQAPVTTTVEQTQ